MEVIWKLYGGTEKTCGGAQGRVSMLDIGFSSSPLFFPLIPLFFFLLTLTVFMLMELRWLNKARRPPPPHPCLSGFHRRGWRGRRAMRRILKGKFPAVAPVALCLWLRWRKEGELENFLVAGSQQAASRQPGRQAGRPASSSHEAGRSARSL